MQPEIPKPPAAAGPAYASEDRPILATLGLLTLATGLVDAASVLGLGHVFTANMTGNVVFLAFSLVTNGAPAPVDCALALVAFLAGALVGGRLAHRRAPFFLGIGLEALLLVVASIIAWSAVGGGFNRVLELCLLGLAMGMQNGCVRKLAVADMTTTVLTLTLTGLASDSRLAGGSNPRVIRRTASVLLMLLGAAAGAGLLRLGVRWTIGAAALVVASSALVAAFSAAQKSSSPARV